MREKLENILLEYPKNSISGPISSTRMVNHNKSNSNTSVYFTDTD